MKKKIVSTLALSVLMGTFVLFNGGCSKTNVMPPESTAANGSAGGSAGTDITYPVAEGGYTEDGLPIEGSLDDTTMSGVAGGLSADQQSDEYKMLHGRSSENLSPIYFDFDQAGVRPDMTEVLVRNADYLNSVPGTVVVIEGNSDERGTSEYNLALGERRAINAQQYLINLGVDPERMRTVSYGEEKPLFLDQNEEAYSMNRRVDFIAN
ncbi:MAG: OmpA family protein [Desulforhopalus sp.]